ncbi:MAG: hypothetical protein M1409_05705 [Actinobacteria bacterium]|nr:hypothetical protein [Actinomycetota bacterium]
MRNFIALIVVVVLGVFLWKIIPVKNQQIIIKKIEKTDVELSPTTTVSNTYQNNPIKSIFVPDWSLTDEIILNNE